MIVEEDFEVLAIRSSHTMSEKRLSDHFFEKFQYISFSSSQQHTESIMPYSNQDYDQSIMVV